MGKNGEMAKEKGKLFVSLVESLKPTQQTWVLLGVGVVVLAVFGVLAYFCWYVWLNGIWSWQFDDETTSWKALRYFLSGLGTIYLLMIPLIPFVAARSILEPIVIGKSMQKRFDDINEEQRQLEEELISKDESGLIQLIQYSRLQLQAYYTIGLSQSKKSFRYSVLAMWIGFVVIISGVVMYVFPLEGVHPNQAEGEVQLLTVASGTVIEVVSALFLWVYSRTIRQLTYFYNRQSYNHTLVMCSKITDKMSEGGDAAKNHIVEKAMEYAWAIPEDNIPGLTLLQKVRGRKIPES